jgi:hypothetical protein
MDEYYERKLRTKVIGKEDVEATSFLERKRRPEMHLHSTVDTVA